MTSHNQYSNNISFSEIEDLFSSTMDFISQNEYDQCYIDQNDTIDELFLSSETDEEQLQTSAMNTIPIDYNMSNLICGVCSAPAHGYNFDQVTCESCKAFFRRNALKDMSKMKCRYSGSCIINIQTRRLCAYCRLKKCFDINMRKDWIRTEEEKEYRQLQKLLKEQKKLNTLTNDQQSLPYLPIVVRKKKHLIRKSLTSEFVIDPIYTMNCFGLYRNVSDDDRILFNNITNAYQSSAIHADNSYINKYTSSVSLTQFIDDESAMHGSLIYFYKSIPEFKELDIEDQILLIKCNLLSIVHLHHIIVENFQDSPHIGKHMSKWIGEDFHRQMSRTRHYFYRFMNYPLLLKLTLTVFIFSINLSIPRGSSQFTEYKNKKKLYDCQNYYTTILWRYLNYLFDEKEAVQSIEIIVMQILRYQILMTKMDSCVRENSNHHKFHSLMESIFGLN